MAEDKPEIRFRVTRRVFAAPPGLTAWLCWVGLEPATGPADWIDGPYPVFLLSTYEDSAEMAGENGYPLDDLDDSLPAPNYRSVWAYVCAFPDPSWFPTDDEYDGGRIFFDRRFALSHAERAWQKMAESQPKQ